VIERKKRIKNQLLELTLPGDTASAAWRGTVPGLWVMTLEVAGVMGILI